MDISLGLVPPGLVCEDSQAADSSLKDTYFSLHLLSLLCMKSNFKNPQKIKIKNKGLFKEENGCVFGDYSEQKRLEIKARRQEL